MSDTPTSTPTPEPKDTVSEPLKEDGTPTPTAVDGDVDGDRVADAAFVGSAGDAEVVLNIPGTPTKLKVDTGVIAADIGKLGRQWAVITVKRDGSRFTWNAINLMDPLVYRTLATSSSLESPVVGCYLDTAYTAAGFMKDKKATLFTQHLVSSSQALSLPRSVMSIRCGKPEAGTSTVYYLNRDKTRKTVVVVGKRDNKVVLSSPRLPPNLKRITLLLVPRGDDQAPTPMIFARQGKTNVLRLLDGAKRWRDIPAPRLDKGSFIRAGGAVRHKSTTYLILQVMNAENVTSYRKIEIDNKMLQTGRSNR